MVYILWAIWIPKRVRHQNKEKRKTYSIDELKDLQSKLMLIAGKAEKGKDDVEQFVRVSEIQQLCGQLSVEVVV